MIRSATSATKSTIAYMVLLWNIYLNYSRQCLLDRLDIVSDLLLAISLLNHQTDCLLTEVTRSLCPVQQSGTLYRTTYVIRHYLWIVSGNF